jgi:hypothetical protein
MSVGSSESIWVRSSGVRKRRARWAAVGPDPESPDAWDLAFGLQGMAIFGGQDDPDDDFELHAVAGGGGIAEVRGGRTWSDFVSVWVAVRAGVVAAELDLADRETTDSARLAWTGGAVGLRVGLRHVFTAFEIGAHWTDVSSGRRDASGFVVTPAIGLAIETR